MRLIIPPSMPDCRSLGGGIWITREPWKFVLEGVQIEVPSGFKTDLYSSPWMVRPFIAQDQPDNRPALVHDFLYGTVGMRRTVFDEPVFSRAECDAALLEAMVQCRFGWLRRRTIYRGVRAGGWLPWARLADGMWDAQNPKMT